MKLSKYYFSLVLLFVFVQIQAQNIGSTFRVGLNFPTFNAPSEIGADGSELESFSSFTGFHVAGGVNFKLLDHYGVKAELMYTQKGTRYRYEGPSTYIFTTTTGEDYPTAIGTRTISNRIANSYIQIPVTGYMKYGKFEINAGASIAFLVGSTGTGDFQFSGRSAADNSPIEISSLINHNYRKDGLEPRAAILNFVEGAFKTVTIDGEDALLLVEETAYAQFTDKNGGVFGKVENTLTEKYYNSVDFNIHAGASFYVSPGLFIGATIDYGLRDVTNSYFDYSYSESEGLNRVERTDKDTNFVIMASVGFSF